MLANYPLRAWAAGPPPVSYVDMLQINNAISNIDGRIDGLETTVKQVRFYDDASGTPQSIPTGADTIVQFRNTRIADPSIVAVSGTGNTTFTIQRNGSYLLDGGFRCVTSAAAAEVSLVVNNARLVNGFGSFGASCFTTAYLFTGDVVKVNAWQVSGAARAIQVGFGESTHISITRVGN